MVTGNANDERRRIVQYWTLLELFNPQSVPKLTRSTTRPADEQVVEWSPGEPLPWNTLTPPKPAWKKTRAWQHTVYLGVYDLEKSYEHLHRAFGEDRDAYDARRAGQSACAAVVLDDKGVLSIESSVLSSGLWALAKLSSGSPSRSPHWAGDFPGVARAFLEQVDEVEGARRDLLGAEHPLPHDEESLQTLLRVAHGAAGITAIPEIASTRIIISSVARTVDGTGQAGDTDFLNSFFLEDLSTVQKDMRQQSPPAALAEYLTPSGAVRENRRVDVMSAHRTVDAGAGIDRLPRGRWPAKPEHALALRQQFAVNTALSDLAPTGGLMGVNGPPGTGKTTMLRDVLAGNVVERARLLAKLKKPTDAFTSVAHTWKTGKYTRTIRQLRPQLTGFEMVVASANNGAVENVSTEIPARDAISKPWRAEADYFSDIATAALRASAKSNTQEFDAWGLVAARLGNKSNRGDFYSSFWFDRKTTPAGAEEPESAPGMQTLLKEWESGAQPHRSWSEARAVFSAKEARVVTLIRQRKAAQSRIEQLAPAAQAAEDAAHQAQQLARDLSVARQATKDHRTALDAAEAELGKATMAWDRHLATRPGWLETLFTWGAAMRTWRSRATSAEERYEAAEASVAQARALAQRLAHQERSLEDGAASATTSLQRTEDELRALRLQLAQDTTSFGPGYPDTDWTGEKRELHAPWLDAELDAARSELFLAALQMHEDFLANAPTDMRKGIHGAIEVVAGKAPRDLEPEKLLAAWQTFFLVVPMVSTTFASYSRMFAGLGRESLGWLFVDEAGQASPQFATGAIGRAKRVVAVGDPLQLPPVVTMPHKAQRDIAQAFGVSDEWIPPQASVQTLADRVSRVGTTLRNGEEDVWVSAPLTVHRRCDDPMFGLCNALAYNGIMVSGVHRTLDDPEDTDLFDTPDGPRIASSRWLHEPAPTAGTHLQENQIDRLRRAIDSLRAEGVDPSEIIAISPFRTVANRLRSLTRDVPDLSAGTIHTAQGREADVVFLVLGGDPTAPGAKTWASETVNLVNVAASRAKRRLYVIGDREQWSRYPYFKELSTALGQLDTREG